jgi:hypothetical protein
MKISKDAQAAFRQEYKMPLRLLERSFQKAGLPIEFNCVVNGYGNKWVQILYNGRLPKVINIEGDSPAQAIKDIAERVEL